jgi:hypothetical protein
MMSTRKRRSKRRRTRLSKARLEQLVEEAIVDCYNESEQVTGLYTMIEDNLALPFETTVLGVLVTVERVDLTQGDEIVAVCRRAGVRQTVPIIDLSLPSPRPVRRPVRGQSARSPRPGPAPLHASRCPRLR